MYGVHMNIVIHSNGDSRDAKYGVTVIPHKELYDFENKKNHKAKESKKKKKKAQQPDDF